MTHLSLKSQTASLYHSTPLLQRVRVSTSAGAAASASHPVAALGDLHHETHNKAAGSGQTLK